LSALALPRTAAPKQPAWSTNLGHDLLSWLAEMRVSRPVWQDRFGIFHVFRYADVQRVLRDSTVFSSDRTRLMPPDKKFGRGSLTMLDPPEHDRQRRLINTAFSASAITALSPRIESIADELLGAITTEHVDLMQSFAYPFPVAVIAEMLGLPPEDRDQFHTWVDSLMSIQIDDPREPEVAATVSRTMADMNEYLRRFCRMRKASPRGDLISLLATANDNGGDFGDDEVVDAVTLLFLAGHVTTTMLILNAVLCIDAHEDARRQLMEDSSLIPLAIDEVLRYRSPFANAGRVTRNDVELGGVHIPEDRFVMAWLLAANHDPGVFESPEWFNIRRSNLRQIAFGHGVHHCVGASLARLEGCIAVRALLTRFAHLRVDRSRAVPFYENTVFGPRRLVVGI
jgi:cytochrome P450